jgi:hypothetical protein
MAFAEADSEAEILNDELGEAEAVLMRLAGHARKLEAELSSKQ